jgi:hypothetical protein
LVAAQRFIEAQQPVTRREFIIVNECNPISDRVAHGLIAGEGDILLRLNLVSDWPG